MSGFGGPAEDQIAIRALIDSFVIDMEQQAIKLVEVAHGERRA